MIKKTLIAMAITASLAGCGDHKASSTTPTTKTNPPATVVTRAQIDTAVSAYTKAFLKLEPALATSLGLADDVIGHYQDKWPDYSPNGMKTLQQAMAQGYQQMNKLSLTGLNDADRLQLEINKVIAKYYEGDPNFHGGYIDTWGGHLPYIVNQISGPLIDLPNVLKDQHRINNAQDARDYLTRLAGLATVVAQVKSKELDDAAHGIMLPKALYPNTLSYLTKFIAPTPMQHALVVNFQTKIAKLTDLTEPQKQQMVQQAATIMQEKVYPAYADITQTMQQLELKAPTADGIWAQPNGDEFYQHEIKYLGDSSHTAEQIHQIGLDEVKRITAEMDTILKAQGMTKGTVGERMAKLGDMPQFIYPDSDAGRQQLLDFLNNEIKKVMAKAPEYFATMPKYSVSVKRIPVVAQDGAAGGFYSAPALDGSRNGVFSINLKDMKAQPKFSLKTLTYHEAVPGHHFQISLNMAQTDIGLMRQNAPFNAYVEGWALYSEHLAYEMGMYDNDPWGNLGRLQAEIYRAARLVVDTGLHYKHWTRQQAISYFADTTGTAMSDVSSAINRYMAWPGQALGYKIGMLKILGLRKWAKHQLGDKFDIKAFHDVVLMPGARPLSILEEDVKRWVTATQ